MEDHTSILTPVIRYVRSMLRVEGTLREDNRPPLHWVRTYVDDLNR